MAVCQPQQRLSDYAYTQDLKAAIKHDVIELSSISSSDDGADIEQRPSPVDDEPVRPILASPYTEAEHLLDPETVQPEYAAFARALTVMQPSRPDYATAPYEQSFNWQTIVTTYLQQSTHQAATSFFVIVFRSRLKIGADRTLLGQLDSEAHLEAVRSGGLLKYWFGSPDADRRNLATCIWRARDDARLGGAGRGHAAAMTAARQMYDEWFVERFRLVIDGTQAVFTQWQD